MSSKVVAAWVKALDKLQFPNSFMIMRNGFVIAEGWWTPYAPGVRHQLFSLSKSFTSFAIGLAISEGRLKLDDLLVSFFPDRLPKGMEEAFNRITVRHLLTMSSGHGACPLWDMRKVSDGDYVRAFFASHLTFEPGTRFVYNSGASYMLSAIVSKVMGRNLVDYLNPRLLHPLGIKDAHWDACPNGISLGGWGFHLATEEIANFAQLLLDNGKWNGRQLIPLDYFKMATSFQIDNSMNDRPDWKLGYGFQFWRSQHNAFRGDGAYGQYALAVPEHNLALAITSGMANMQSILTLVWDILLPGAGKTALPENVAALSDLRNLSSSLRIPLAQGDGVAKTGNAEFEIEDNPVGIKRIGFKFSKKSCAITFETPAAAETIKAGFGKNVLGEDMLFYGSPRKIAASAAWKSPSLLEVSCCYYESPFIVTFNCRFEGNALRLESSSNLKFGTSDWAPLQGMER